MAHHGPPKHKRWPFSQIMRVERERIAYQPIAKNACTSLKAMMIRLAEHPEADEILAGDIHRRLDTTDTGLLIKDLGTGVLHQVLGQDDWFRFAVLREPRDRLLSAYRDKFVKNRNEPGSIHMAEPLAKIAGCGIDDMTFRMFCETVMSIEPIELNTHWRDQHLYFLEVPCNRFYTVDGLDLLAADLSARCGHPIDIPHHNRSRTKEREPVPGVADRRAGDFDKAAMATGQESFFDASLRAAVDRRFAIDAALFHAADAAMTARRRLEEAQATDLDPQAAPNRPWRKRLSLNGIKRLVQGQT